MSILATTLALILLTVGAGYLLWCLRLHFEELHTEEQSEVSHRTKGGALLFLALAGIFVLGTLAVLLVEIQQLFMAKSL